MLEAKLLPALLRIVSTDVSLEAKQRALYALSAMIRCRQQCAVTLLRSLLIPPLSPLRNFDQAQRAFVNNGGVNALAALFSKRGTSIKLQIKAVRFLTDLLAEHKDSEAGDDAGLHEAIDANDFCQHILSLLDVKDRDAVYVALEASSQVLSGGLRCKEVIRTRIDSLKREAVDLLSSMDKNEDDLHRWVQELIGEQSTDQPHDEL